MLLLPTQMYGAGESGHKVNSEMVRNQVLIILFKLVDLQMLKKFLFDDRMFAHSKMIVAFGVGGPMGIEYY